ncbi:MAG: cbb3-type cytochrome oxidase assembly protein CcoS [Tepidisphaera sp.]|nr:cbb3-type cytochrome oxidase assembly protein CcoS [Tepidisphaera sp.]
MSVLYIAVPLAVVIAGAFLAGFIWSVRRGQYDDVETPAHRMLDDD